MSSFLHFQVPAKNPLWSPGWAGSLSCSGSNIWDCQNADWGSKLYTKVSNHWNTLKKGAASNREAPFPAAAAVNQQAAAGEAKFGGEKCKRGRGGDQGAKISSVWLLRWRRRRRGWKRIGSRRIWGLSLSLIRKSLISRWENPPNCLWFPGDPWEGRGAWILRDQQSNWGASPDVPAWVYCQNWE